MSETESPPLINSKPYQLLDAREAEEIQRLDRGEMTCPQCGSSLAGGLANDQSYQGVVVTCFNCDFAELG